MSNYMLWPDAPQTNPYEPVGGYGEVEPPDEEEEKREEES